MIVYEATKEQFVEDVVNNRISKNIERLYRMRVGSNVNPREVKAWENSMQFMNNVLNDGSIPNSYYLTLEQCNGEIARVFIKEIDQVPETNKYYEFTIQPKVSTNYIEDTIDSIFNNSRILGINETNKKCDEQIKEKIDKYNK